MLQSFETRVNGGHQWPIRAHSLLAGTCTGAAGHAHAGRKLSSSLQKLQRFASRQLGFE